MNSKIVELLPSAWWKTAVVIVLACGHRHVRPNSQTFIIDEDFDCCYCNDLPKL